MKEESKLPICSFVEFSQLHASSLRVCHPCVDPRSNLGGDAPFAFTVKSFEDAFSGQIHLRGSDSSFHL